MIKMGKFLKTMVEKIKEKITGTLIAYIIVSIIFFGLMVFVVTGGFDLVEEDKPGIEKVRKIG